MMRQKDLVFFLEGESDAQMLKGIVPRLMADAHANSIKAEYITLSGGIGIRANLKARMEGYLNPLSAFVVLRDQDSENCRELKRELLAQIPAIMRARTLVRIACRDLESFYLGDLEAVSQGLNTKLRMQPGDARKFANPDKMVNVKPGRALHRVSDRKYKKIRGSRAIAPHLTLDGSNKSRSFNVLVAGIRRQIQLLGQMTA